MECPRERDGYQVCDCACVCKPMCVHTFLCPIMETHMCAYVWSSLYVHDCTCVSICVLSRVCVCYVTVGSGTLG